MSKRYKFMLNPQVYKGIPCQDACPVHTDVKGYIELIAQGKMEEAYNLIRETNPFPSICGRICPHCCEYGCSRQRLDKSVSIRMLKRAASDYMLKNRVKPVSKAYGTLEKIAIIGAGPAGLTAAHDLAKLGYRVTVFESLPYGGGMLRVGVPAFRLPREIIDSEIEDIKALGVNIQYNVTIGKDLELADLKQDYAAVLIAAGAQKSVPLGVPGEEYKGIIPGLTFMRNVNTGIDMGLEGKRVGVVGGGFTAMDAARSAIRLGAKESYMIFRRTRSEIPLNEERIIEAEEEGVRFKYLSSPVKILSSDGVHLSGIECLEEKLREADKSGRRRPISIKGTECVIDLDFVIPAIGQKPDMSFLNEKYGFRITIWGALAVDPESLETNIKGIFSCGEYLTGTRDVINVIADGHKSAIGIDKYIMGNGAADREYEVKIETPGYPIKEKGYDSIDRQHCELIPIQDRTSTFKEAELGFNISEAINEGMRCLSCDHIWAHEPDECFLCQNCVEICPTNALTSTHLNESEYKRYFHEGILFRELSISPINIKRELCIRCGLCEQVCPCHCITFTTCKENCQK